MLCGQKCGSNFGRIFEGIYSFFGKNDPEISPFFKYFIKKYTNT